MKGILGKLKLSNQAPITDDEYREMVTAKALAMLNALFGSTPDSLQDEPTLDILVIGTGMFPSFMPLIAAITRIAPKLSSIKFDLVEPLKTETDRFELYYKKIAPAGTIDGILIQYYTHNVDIKKYLHDSHNRVYDIIYFEQPDLSPIGILLAANGVAGAKLELSLRESIPYLKNVIHPKTIIIASFLYKRDMTQLSALINYGLKIPTQQIHQLNLGNDGSPYNSGLISVIDTTLLPEKTPDIIATTINRHDLYYSTFLMTSFLILFFTPAPGKIFSVFFTISLLFYHRYGMGSFLIKTSIIFAQLAIMAGIFYLT